MYGRGGGAGGGGGFAGHLISAPQSMQAAIWHVHWLHHPLHSDDAEGSET